jgi:tripartite-type tricarboxylate transporter receptor subunit TctC
VKLKSLVGLLPFIISIVLAQETCVQAQPYPNHPVRLIVAFSASGSVDALGRILAQKLGEYWGQQVAVENRTGALGNIGPIAADSAFGGDPGDSRPVILFASPCGQKIKTAGKTRSYPIPA